MHPLAITIIATACVVLLVSIWRYFSLRNKRKPGIEVDFLDSFAPFPGYGCAINPDIQIACRVWQRLDIKAGSVEFLSLDRRADGRPRTLSDVRSFFNRQGHSPQMRHPFPPHLIPLYLNGSLKLPREMRGKHVVFLGLIWNYLRSDERFPETFVQGIGPDEEGKMALRIYGDDTEFTEEFVVPVRRLPIRAPYGVLAATPSTA